MAADVRFRRITGGKTKRKKIGGKQNRISFYFALEGKLTNSKMR
jgi:hypothetical protein